MDFGPMIITNLFPNGLYEASKVLNQFDQTKLQMLLKVYLLMFSFFRRAQVYLLLKVDYNLLHITRSCSSMFGYALTAYLHD